MLEFAVYDENGPAKHWPLVGAHLLGRDDLATEGKVQFNSDTGRIVCQKRGSRAVGLSLLYDAGAMGRLMLQTALLPDRDEPYILSVELARHRIKMFIVKSEEWQMFELSAGHPAMELWEKARQLFTQAVNSSDPVAADRLARQSLEAGIDATERLALAHAEILLHRRFGARRASSATLGVRVSPAQDSQGLRELVGRDFDVLVMPLTWRDLEVEEGRYNWESLDRWMNWAREQGKPVVAGPLIDFSQRAVPDWMYVWQHDYDTCRDMLYDHVERVVQRYRNHVGIWNIAAGLNTNENFRFSADQMVDLVRMAALIVRQSRKGARIMVEMTQPFGEHGSEPRGSVAPFAFIERLIQEGIRMDALGVQLLFGEQRSGRMMRDLMQISNLLDRFFLIEVPLIVSALGMPSTQVREDGGWWHDAMSPGLQATWAGRVFAMAMSKPYLESIFWCELFDHPGSILPGAGLVSQDGRTKPALSKIVNLRKRLRKPLGPLKLPNRAEPATQ